MSQFGSGNTPAQPQQTGQVAFFDPSKFQKGSVDFPAAPASQPNTQPQQPPYSSSQNFTSNADTSQSSWSSWGAWNGTSNPYSDSSSSQSNYVNSSTSQDAQAFNANAGQQVGNVQNDVNAGQEAAGHFQNNVASDAQYNQQWYDQSQWNQAPQQAGQFQQHWDPNTQQWLQYDYSQQQVSDPNQFSGYNQYWGGSDTNGVNGHDNNAYNTGHQQTEGGNQIVQSANNYFVGDPRSHVAQPDTEVGQESVLSTSMTESSPRDETSDELDVSQSTGETESESQNHSLGQFEEGSLDGCFQTEDFVQEESETKVVQQIEQSPPHSIGFIPQEGFDNIGNNVIGQNNENISGETGLEGGMQAVSLQDNMMSQDGQGHFVPTFQPAVNQSQAMQPPVQLLPVAQTQQQQQPPAFSEHPAVQQMPNTGEAKSHGANQHPAPPVPQSREHQTPTFSDWEMVPPQREAQATHSRNASIDNNVHFFISSTNSSARVSPSTSSKTGGDDTDTQSGQPSSAPNTDKRNPAGAHPQPDVTQASAANLGPPPIILRPPSQGSNKGDNPFRKSPNTSMLSSTHMDNTKGNMDESEVMLNRSISPIAPTEELKSQRLRQEDRNIDSPDIHIAQPSEADTRTNAPPGLKNPSVPQSPILPRKDSPFQPPAKVASDNKGKPLKASHNMPGMGDYVQRQTSEEKKERGNGNDREVEKSLGRKTPDWDKTERRREGRRTPDWDRKREGRKTPEWDSGNKRREGRRTPDWDSAERRREGRRTPDWDSSGKKREGRRTPDWDSSQRRREGRRTPDWDRSDRGPDDRRGEGFSGRPPTGPADNANKARRSRQSAFRQYEVNRSKNNVSPATSLWDTPVNLTNVSNILLVPAAGGDNSKISGNSSVSKDSNAPSVLTPVASLITSLSEQIKTEEPKDKLKGDDKYKRKANDEQDKDSRHDRDRDITQDTSVRSGYSRDRDKDTRDRLRSNRSYDSLRDRDRERDRGKDSRNSSRDRNLYGSRDSLDQDDSRDRGRRGDSRERERGYRERDSYYDRYRDRDRERPPSRTSTVDGYGRRDYRDRDYYRRDRPDRPKSRQGERPSSRQGDSERPRSRADYERDQYYKDKYKNQGYDYDEYYRRGGQYYDRQYYDYYYGNYGQGGYYDEYGYYHQDNNQSRYRYDNYQRRSRTGTPGSLSDGGEEISKIADASKTPDSKSDKKRFDYPPDLHDYSKGGYDEYNSYYGYEQNGYRWDPDIQNWVATTTDVVPQRQTPEKFVIPHVVACFGPTGQLVRVVPNRPADGEPATVEIIDVQELLNDTEESEELHEFPGPLVKGDTHKNDILLFTQRKAKECNENVNLEDRESAELIWKFLELLIKQNGTVVGTDIADLLLQGHEPTTLDYRRTGMKIAASTDFLEVDDNESEGSRVSRGTTPVDRSLVVSGKGSKSVEDVTDRFRHLLLYGRKKDALEWAMKNNLWGHALFLASKMDSRAHANVMTRFANVAMRMNDPLQTLYQLMSGRQPAAVTSATEERWGDWRPHLAMILSNHTHKPDLDRKCITTLGDTLASKGLLHASHFCYLMSQTSFGSYTRKSSKIVLVGMSHGLPLEHFAKNEAVQCTEVYEYALALGNTCVCLANFQYFKYMYCTRLVDCGYAQEALQYCEVISRNINMNPAFYSHILVKLVYDLSCQLKYADPQYADEGEEDSPDPEWLRGLHTTLVQFEEGAIQPLSGTNTPAYFGAMTRASSESGEVGMYMHGQDNGNGYIQDQSYIAAPGQMYSIQEQSHYQQNITGQAEYQQHQYSQAQYETGTQQAGGNQLGEQVPAASNQYGDQVAGAGDQYSQLGGSQYEPGTEAYNQQQQQQQQQQQYAEGQYVQSNWTDPTAEAANQAQEPHPAIQHTADTANQNTGSHYQQGDQQVTQYQTNQQTGNQWSHGHHQQPSGFPPNVNLGESQNSGVSKTSTKRSSMASTSSFSQNGDEEEDPGVDSTDGGYHQQPSIFDLQPTQQKIIAPRLRQRTISESSQGSVTSGHAKKSAQSKDSGGDSLDGKGKQKQQGGGIWNKLTGGLFSRKNEMKLPDDKEPSIVWDAAKQKWVDKDADEVDSGAPAPPPPKDADLSGPPSQMPTVPEGSSSSFTSNTAAMPPPAGGNKFSRRKGIGAGSRYVDVMNPKPASGAHVPPSLFNTLPNSHSAPAIFNPGGSADLSASEPSSQQQPQKQETIPEEKPASSGADISSASQPGGSSLSLPPSDNTSGPVPTGLPTMFNPAQFQADQQSFKQPAAPTAGHRLSSRRVYPK